MNNRKELYEYTFSELDRELIARGVVKIKSGEVQLKMPEGPDVSEEEKAQMERIIRMYQSASEPNGELDRFSTAEIAQRLKSLSRGQKKTDTEAKHKKAIIETDDRIEAYEIETMANLDLISRNKSGIDRRTLNELDGVERMKKIKKNLEGVALICYENCLETDGSWVQLKVESYKERFSLCDCERFSDQPVCAGLRATGFLVGSSVIATAGHVAGLKPIKDLRVLFGFRMENESKPVIRVPVENVYQATLIEKKDQSQNEAGEDWALLQLDRPVTGREFIPMSDQMISTNQPVYTIGHPSGLPLKFAAGAQVYENQNASLFTADLDIYMSNSGSPVFDMNTHQLIGMVIHGYSQDFRMVDGCCISIIYPPANPETAKTIHLDSGTQIPLAKCTRISLIQKRFEALKCAPGVM